MYKASKDKVAKTKQLRDGRIWALSSDEQTIYVVTIDPPSCTCPAGQNGRTCYHVRTAQDRYVDSQSVSGC